MAQVHHGYIDMTFIAAADLRTGRYHIVKWGSTDGEVDFSTAATGCCGILQNEPNIGEMAVVRVFGPSKCMVDGTTDVVCGDGIVPTTGSHGIKGATDKDFIVGRALQAQAANEARPIEVFVNPVTLSVT
jgi:hypothetical protein